MATKKIKSRKFLNKKDGLAAIEVNFDFQPEQIFYSGWDANLSISDCRKTINLDFCAYSEKSIDELITKAQILIDEITKLQEAMIANRASCIERIKESDKKRKERIKNRATKPVSEIIKELNDDN